MEYQQTGGKNKKSIVIVTIVMAVIVVALLIAVIVTAVNKTKKRNIATNNTTTISLNTTASDRDPAQENPAPVENNENSTVSNNTTLPGEATTEPIVDTPVIATTENTESLPETGPTDLLPVILILALGATFATSSIYAKKF